MAPGDAEDTGGRRRASARKPRTSKTTRRAGGGQPRQPAPADAPTPGASEPTDDALRRLGDRLEQASEAAERLFAQAAGEAATHIQDRVKPPPRGWQTSDEPAPAPPSPDVALLLQAVRELIPADLKRELIPAELRDRLVEAVRELLLAIRAVIDWYVARLEQRRAEPVEVQDIPIQ
jgi:hypothetical protein